MTINYYLKNPNAAETLVRLTVQHKGQRYRYYTGLTVQVKDWIQTKQSVRQGVRNPAGQSINAQLDAIKARAERCWRDYTRECVDQGRRSTFGEFCTRLKNDLDLLLMKKERTGDLFKPENWINDYIERCNTQKLKSEGTIKNYRVAFHWLKTFADQYHKRLTFYNMDLTFAARYRQFRFDQGRAINTVWKELKTFAHWLTEAHADGYNPYDFHKQRGWNIKDHKPRNIYLTFDQAEELYKLPNLPNYIRRTVDEFICAMFSGVRFSDFSKILDVENIRTDPDGFEYFVVDQQKVKYRCNIPVHPIVKEILQSYGGSISRISHQKTNEYIKEAAKLASWGNDREFLDDSSGGEVTPVIVKKYEAVTTHTARRSFATNMYLAGVPKDTIMKITGHRKVESFDRYICLDDIEHAKVIGMNDRYVQAFNRTA